MDELTEEELAERADTTLEQIARLRRAGVIESLPDGSFSAGEVQRVRLIEACEHSGIAVEDMGRAIREGHLSLAFLDLIFSSPVGHAPQTYEEMCRTLGWSFEFVELIHEAMGLPRPLPEQRVREDDVQMFPTAQFVRATGMEEVNMSRVLRVYAENLARIAHAEAQFFHSYIEQPMLTSRMSELQMLATASQLSPQLQEMVRNLILWLYRRHQEHYIIEHVVEHIEVALEEAGVTRRRVARPPAMMFLDLAGYTRLTEERGDEVAAELAASLASLVHRGSRRRDGRPVKWLGDGVMFHFPNPANAVACAMDLIDETPAAGLPPAHVGVNAGPVVFRDGDYFGRTVNIAARIASQAKAGEVLVSEEVVSLAGGNGFLFEQLGPFELKGLLRPIELYRVGRSGPG